MDKQNPKICENKATKKKKEKKVFYSLPALIEKPNYCKRYQITHGQISTK